jgi:hypothetical protein
MPDIKSGFSVRMKPLLFLSLDRDELILYVLIQIFEHLCTTLCIFKYNLWTSG